MWITPSGTLTVLSYKCYSKISKKETDLNLNMAYLINNTPIIHHATLLTVLNTYNEVIEESLKNREYKRCKTNKVSRYTRRTFPEHTSKQIRKRIKRSKETHLNKHGNASKQITKRIETNEDTFKQMRKRI